MLSSNLWRNPWRSSDKPFDLGIRGVNEDRDVKVDHDEARLICRTRHKNVTRLQIEMRYPICVYEGDSLRELVHEIEGDKG
jgi:hypothetical protein